MAFALSLNRRHPAALVALKRSKPAQIEFNNELSVHKVMLFYNLSTSWATGFVKAHDLNSGASSRHLRSFVFTLVAFASAEDPDPPLYHAVKRYREDGVTAALIDKIISAAPVDLDPEDKSKIIDPVDFLVGIGVPEEIIFACEAAMVDEKVALGQINDLYALSASTIQVRVPAHYLHLYPQFRAHPGCPAAGSCD